RSSASSFASTSKCTFPVECLLVGCGCATAPDLLASGGFERAATQAPTPAERTTRAVPTYRRSRPPWFRRRLVVLTDHLLAVPADECRPGRQRVAIAVEPHRAI